MEFPDYNKRGDSDSAVLDSGFVDVSEPITDFTAESTVELSLSQI